MEASSVQNFPIVKSNNEHNLIGVISRTDLSKVLNNAKYTSNDFKVYFDRAEASNIISLTRYVDNAPLSVDPEDTMEYLVDLFKKMGPQYVVVKKMGKLRGIITKKDLLLVLR